MLIFFFILTKTLISIVIIRYRYLRSVKQLNNEARAKMIGRQTKKFNEKLINLLLCRKYFREDSSITLRTTNWMTFKLNFRELLQVNNIKSKESYDKELKEIQKDILLKRREKKKERALKYSASNVELHSQSMSMFCYYLAYLVLFVLVVTLQLRLTD